MTRQLLKAIIDSIGERDIEIVREISKNPKTKMLEAVIAVQYLAAYDHGSKPAFEFLMDRSVGKVPETKVEPGDDDFKPEKYVPRESMAGVNEKPAEPKAPDDSTPKTS